MVCGLGLAASVVEFRIAAGFAQSVPNAVLASIMAGNSVRPRVTAQNAEDSGWLPATVPGDVHLDLLANKKIPDPFYRDNEAKLQWIEKASWEYRLTSMCTPALLARANVDLVFDGLDAAAEVYLNGAQVLSADNMFRIWRVPVKDHLHAGKNVLRVVFPSPIKAAAEGGGHRSLAAEDKDRAEDLHPQSRL